MMNEEFIVRMFEKQKERLEMAFGENVYNLVYAVLECTFT